MRAQASLTALAALIALAASATPAAAAPTQLLATLEVTADSIPQNTGAVVLTPGATYRLVMSGEISITFPYRDGSRTVVQDALYCYDHGGTPIPADDPEGERCQRDSPGPALTRPLVVSYAGIQDGPLINEAISDQHRYVVDFIYRPAGPATSLVAQWKPGTVTAHGGSIKVELYGEPSPGSTGPAPIPETTLRDLLQMGDCGIGTANPQGWGPRLNDLLLARASRADDFCPRRGQMPGWNLARPLGNLAPGDQAIVTSADLGANQREATVKLVTSKGDIAVALSLDDAKFRRFARRACMLVAEAELIGDIIDAGLDRSGELSVDVGAFGGVTLFGRYLLTCLRRVDDKLAGARGAAARTAATGCRPLTFPVRLLAGGDPNRVRFRVRRSDPLPRELTVTCKATSSGLELRIRPRRAGIPLRRVVGKRFAVGLSRSPRATGTTKPSIVFRR